MAITPYVMQSLHWEPNLSELRGNADLIAVLPTTRMFISRDEVGYTQQKKQAIAPM